ncbi:MAG: ABC transporter substrate-binding protein [Anaerolineae bacterium]|nr:ABC transporter substrate-binding protein [Anaerolineae bacterium]
MRGGKYFQNRVVNRWTILTLMTVLALLLGGCCPREEPKVYRVGVLAGLAFVADITDGFKAGMAELGYVEGENIIYDVQSTDFDMEAYRNILQQFVEDKVDLIFVFPTEATMEAKVATEGTDIPVVFSFALIEGMGIVDSVREPGGNVTGVRYPGPDIAIKRFEIMRELAPEATRMLIPYQKGYPIVGPQLEALRPVAEAAGVTLIEAPAADAAELDAILQAQVQPDGVGMDAILFLAEPLAVTPDPFAVMGKFAYEHKVPIGGALMAAEGYESVFGVNVESFACGKQAAPLADKIFRGTPPGEIPVVSAENFIQINYKAAQVMGLTVPDGLLSEADEVIR